MQQHPAGEIRDEGPGRRHVHQQWHAPVQAPHRFGVRSVDAGCPRPLELFQGIDKVHLPARRDPPVDLLHGGSLVPDRVGEQ